MPILNSYYIILLLKIDTTKGIYEMPNQSNSSNDEASKRRLEKKEILKVLRSLQNTDYVHPDEMIEHLSEFDSREIIGFLYYCTIYKERFCDGVYGLYAKEGFIGRLLIRLKEILLPQ